MLDGWGTCIMALLHEERLRVQGMRRRAVHHFELVLQEWRVGSCLLRGLLHARRGRLRWHDVPGPQLVCWSTSGCHSHLCGFPVPRLGSRFIDLKRRHARLPSIESSIGTIVVSWISYRPSPALHLGLLTVALLSLTLSRARQVSWQRGLRRSGPTSTSTAVQYVIRPDSRMTER